MIVSVFKNGGLVSCLFDCSALRAIQTLAAPPLITTCYQPANKTDKADSMSSELTAPPSILRLLLLLLFHYLNMRHTQTHTCYLKLESIASTARHGKFRASSDGADRIVWQAALAKHCQCNSCSFFCCLISELVNRSSASSVAPLTSQTGHCTSEQYASPDNYLNRLVYVLFWLRLKCFYNLSHHITMPS